MKCNLKISIPFVMFILVVILLYAFYGCKDDDPTQPSTKSIDGVNDYLLELPPWEAFSPPEQDTTAIGESNIEFDYQNQVIRKTTSWWFRDNGRITHPAACATNCFY